MTVIVVRKEHQTKGGNNAGQSPQRARRHRDRWRQFCGRHPRRNACVSAARAASYPERPIRLIGPFSVGGTVDIIARIIGAKLSEIAASKVVVHTEMTVQAPGDGCMLLIHNGAIAYDPPLHIIPSSDTIKNLAPIGLIGTTSKFLIVTPSFPASSAQHLIQMAREKPDGITYPTGGFGSSSHLAVALLSVLSGAKFNHVPYDGTAPALAVVLAGHVGFTVATMPAAIHLVRSNGRQAFWRILGRRSINQWLGADWIIFLSI